VVESKGIDIPGGGPGSQIEDIKISPTTVVLGAWTTSGHVGILRPAPHHSCPEASAVP